MTRPRLLAILDGPPTLDASTIVLLAKSIRDEAERLYDDGAPCEELSCREAMDETGVCPHRDAAEELAAAAGSLNLAAGHLNRLPATTVF